MKRLLASCAFALFGVVWSLFDVAARRGLRGIDRRAEAERGQKRRRFHDFLRDGGSKGRI